MGGGVGGLGAGIPAGEGLLAGDGRAAAQARHRPVPDRAAGRDHRRAALSRGRPVRVRAQRRPRHPGRVRRSRQRCAAGSRRRAAAPRRAAGAARDDPGAAAASAAEVAGPRSASTPRIEETLPRRTWEDAEGRALGDRMLGRRLLDAARSPRHAGAPRADGPRQGGGGDGRALCARGSPRAASAPASIRASWSRGSPCSSTSSRKASGTCSRRAPIEVALAVEPAFEKPGEHQATRRLVRAAARHVSRLGRQAAHAAHRDRATRRAPSHPAAADQRLRRPSRCSRRRSACTCSSSPTTTRGGPRHGARAPRGGAAGRPAGRQLQPLLKAALHGAAAAAASCAATASDALAARAQHERQLAHRQARRRAARRLRPDRRQAAAAPRSPRAAIVAEGAG